MALPIPPGACVDPDLPFRLFAAAYALIYDEPDDSRLVEQMARFALDTADAGRRVLTFGWGEIRGRVAEYQYIAPRALLEGRDVRRKPHS
jgi:hypothetical protein